MKNNTLRNILKKFKKKDLIEFILLNDEIEISTIKIVNNLCRYKIEQLYNENDQVVEKMKTNREDLSKFFEYFHRSEEIEKEIVYYEVIMDGLYKSLNSEIKL